MEYAVCFMGSSKCLEYHCQLPHFNDTGYLSNMSVRHTPKVQNPKDEGKGKKKERRNFKQIVQ